MKKFINNIKECIKYYRFIKNKSFTSYTDLLESDLYFLNKLRNNVKGNRSIERINTTIKLLEIIIKNGEAIFIGDYWSLANYVNTNNSFRFYNSDPDYYNHYDGDFYKDKLRIRKAFYLYFKMKEAWIKTW